MELQQSSRLEKIYPSSSGHNNLKLKRLNLENCNLTTLSSELFEWHEIEDLFIGGNSYICDEKLKWLIEDTKIKIDKVGPEPRQDFEIKIKIS